ncbi:MAG: hypothetical protein ACOC9T_00125 [Myxococcota bacterium]
MSNHTWESYLRPARVIPALRRIGTAALTGIVTGAVAYVLDGIGTAIVVGLVAGAGELGGRVSERALDVARARSSGGATSRQ